MRRRTVLTGLSAAAVALAAPALAQTFPSRPFRLVVPFPPGGGTDIAARVVAEALAERLGQPVVVDNRPGANGAIAGEIVARAPADGYTILVATAAGFASAPALGQQLPYDVTRDFAVLGMLGLFPVVLNVTPSLPAQNFQEFVALAKARPEALNYASAGIGGTNHLVMELVSDAAGIRLTHVPYRGAGPAATDLMSGQVQAMIDSMAASLGNIRGARVRALAVASAERAPQLPDLPTFREQGLDFTYYGWASLVVPAATPSPAVERLARELTGFMGSEALVRRYRELSIQPVTWDPARSGAFMAEDRRILTDLIRTKGIRPE